MEHSLDYELGEYVTGKDRSYERSVYIARKITSDRVHTDSKKMKVLVYLECISYRKRRHLSKHLYEMPLKIAREYRKATRKELVEEGVIPQSIDFILGEKEHGEHIT